MTSRIAAMRTFQGLIKPLQSLEAHRKECSLDRSLRQPVAMRASPINGCAHCLAGHARDALRCGERVDRLFVLVARREPPWFSDREPAALARTEALTTPPNHGVPDAVFVQAREQFSERELSDLTLAVIALDGFNHAGGAWNAPVPFEIPVPAREPVSAN